MTMDNNRFFLFWMKEFLFFCAKPRVTRNKTRATSATSGQPVWLIIEFRNNKINEKTFCFRIDIFRFFYSFKIRKNLDGIQKL